MVSNISPVRDVAAGGHHVQVQQDEYAGSTSGSALASPWCASHRALLLVSALMATIAFPIWHLWSLYIGQVTDAGGIDSSAKMNILLFEADQVRPDAHAWGNSHAEVGVAITPNLDSIAKEGVRFRRAYSSTPICTPARLAILTGRSPWRHGMRSYQAQVPLPRADQLELVSMLADQGYHTSVVGKNHFGLYPEAGPLNGTKLAPSAFSFVSHGFLESHLYEGLLTYDPQSPNFVRLDDYGEFFARVCPGCDPLATEPPSQDPAAWRDTPGATPYISWNGYVFPYPESMHPTHWTADSAIRVLRDFIARRRSGFGRPLFLKVSFHRPHPPYDPPQRWLDRVLERWHAIPRPAVGNWARPNEHDPVCTASPSQPRAHCGKLTTSQVRQMRAFYYASLSFVDEQAGRVLASLRSSPKEWHRTFIMYLSDHGDALGDHYLFRKGCVCLCTLSTVQLARCVWSPPPPPPPPVHSLMSVRVCVQYVATPVAVRRPI